MPPESHLYTAEGAGPGDRPLAHCLDTFWQGDFRLHDGIGPREAAPTALDGLGPSGITVRGRELATLLAAAYRSFTADG
ncbi:hypothetical protein [Kitasatospora camelliae]|uniref:Uncharacterized protein n=1 Tax=Kitasatospora camelliae TaxID=3156397 RepID=A0AAU8JVH1_9ACTN